jgi:hypothetical protein
VSLLHFTVPSYHSNIEDELPSASERGQRHATQGSEQRGTL